jgi:hypothetical protein
MSHFKRQPSWTCLCRIAQCSLLTPNVTADPYFPDFSPKLLPLFELMSQQIRHCSQVFLTSKSQTRRRNREEEERREFERGRLSYRKKKAVLHIPLARCV